MYVHHKDIHSTVTQHYQPPSDTCIRARPSRGVVQGAGSRMGIVWKVYVHVCSSYARSSLCIFGVFPVTVCIEMN